MRNVSGLKTKFVSPQEMLGDTAAWTLAYTSDRFAYSCDATDEVAKLYMSLKLPLLNDDTVGEKYDPSAMIEKIELEYTVGTAALDAAVSAEIHSQARAVDGAAPVVTTVASTVAGVTVTDTKTVDDHLVTIVPNTAVKLNGTKALNLEVAFDKAATSTVTVHCARIYFKEMIA
jgi:hypothetical protein